ncbi:helix-turn-helix domain-containing protein [Microbacterium sp. ISL-103]|uniref:helix-turn-helix transcriptional regulator n=1 Tax=Microbacterium sp. ISL-103 TaxID=2819156 RepID=UPI001BEAC3BC|nr:helix-turn-helix transcriptional regulator [Microbacterium sp. ISL-103]MBT2474664.1 helix-turn-helix domain-containing protein [Microbacterium sp. ISL-103]
MVNKNEVRDFLISRRGNITPAQAGIPDFGTERRVPGLRREEVALLAGVSLDYYTRLERGNIRGASEGVLGAVATALQLDDIERAHLFDLARNAPAVTARPRKVKSDQVRSSVQRVLNNLSVPAIVHNVQQDLIGANLLGRALYTMHFESDRPSMARFIFLDPRAEEFYVDWPLARRLTAAMLRLQAGRDPLNADLTSLIGELSNRSLRFRKDWGRQDVHAHRFGQKQFLHPQVGVLDLTFDAFEVQGESGLTIVTYTAEENSETADKLKLLGSWARTQESPEAQEAPAPASQIRLGEMSPFTAPSGQK